MQWVLLHDIEDKDDLNGFTIVWNPEGRTPLIDDAIHDLCEDEE